MAYAVPALERPIEGIRRPMVVALAIAATVALALGVAVALVRPREWTASTTSPVPWLATTPDARAAVGPVALDGSVADVIEHLGPPNEIVPDLGGEARVWSLPGGASLSVTTPTGALAPVVGVVAVVPAGSPTRVGLFGDLALGEATVTDVVRAWGPPDRYGRAVDDYAVRYVECRGAWPIVLKIEPTRVLVAYADAAPGSAPCGSLS